VDLFFGPPTKRGRFRRAPLSIELSNRIIYRPRAKRLSIGSIGGAAEYEQRYGASEI